MFSSTLIVPLILQVNLYVVNECDCGLEVPFFFLITEKETDKTHNYYCITRELHKIPFSSKKAPKPLKINILLYTEK